MLYSVEINNKQDCEELYKFLCSVQCDGLRHCNLQLIVNGEININDTTSFRIWVRGLKFEYIYAQYIPDPGTTIISVKDFKNLFRRVQL